MVMEDSIIVFQFGFFLETKCSTSEPYKLDSAYVKEDAINVASLLLYRLAFIGTGYETYTRERCVRKLSYYFLQQLFYY